MPSPDPDLLRTFLAIVETRSFSAAALRVGRTPSAVSMQIKRLEEVIGRRLFERDSRTVRLTPHAETIVPEVRRWLEQGAALMGHLRAPELTGHVAIGIPDDYASVHMPAILKRFAHSHPAVQVEVTCLDSTELIAMLRAGTLDATLATLADTGEQAGLLVDVVREEQIVWLGAAGGGAWSERPLPLAAAEAHCPWRLAASAALERAAIPYRAAYTSALSAGQLAAVAADLAVAPLPLCLAGGGIERVAPEAGLPDLPVTEMAFVRRSDADPLVRALHAHVRELFGTPPATNDSAPRDTASRVAA